MRYFYVRIDVGFSNSIYSVYYTLPPAGNLALLFNPQGSTLVATGLTYTQLTTGNGVLVEIPNTAEKIYLYDAAGNFCSVGIENDYRIKSMSLPAPTATPTSTPTATPTPTPNCDFDIDVIFITATPTPTPTPTDNCNFEIDLGIVTATPTPTPTPTPNCNFEIDLGIVTATPTPTPSSTGDCRFEVTLGIVTATPTPTPSSSPTNTPTPSPTPSSTPTPTPTPSSTPTPTPTPTNNCEFGVNLNVVTATPTPTPTATGDCTFDISLGVVTATPTPTPTPSPTTNFAPTDITLSNSSINENTATGTTIGTFTATTLDVSDTHTFSLVTGSGDTDNASFTLTSGGVLKNAFIPNYESKTSYAIRVRATDSAGQTFDKAFTITINNVNEAPYGLSLSVTSQAENTATGTTIGTFSTSDVDSGDTFTYTLVTGSGDTDNASFTISGSSLKNAIVFNYESKTSYSIRVRTTDAGGLYYEGTFTITVTNVNEAPTNISLSSASISENVPTGTTIGTFSATDQEGGTMTYTLYDTVNYPDNSSFSITSGVLKSAVVFDYETKNSYTIRVRVTDSTSLTYDKTLIVTITDVTITPSLTVTNATCYGGTGSIVVSSVAGGTANYTYSRNNIDYQVSSTFSSLSAGNYNIYAKDTYGETGYTSTTITQPTQLSVGVSSSVTPACWTGATGQIVLTSSGGSGTYDYSIDGGSTWQTSATFTGLTSNYYYAKIRDRNTPSCVTSSTIVDLNRYEPSASYSQTNVDCYGNSSGQIIISSMYGGVGAPYSIKLSDKDTQSGGTYQVTTTSRTYSGKAAGTYYYKIKDADGCESDWHGITITQPTQLSVSLSVGSHPTCYTGNTGSVVATASGGSGSYTYYISSNGSNYTGAQSSGTFSSLATGTYSVLVVDAHSCTAFSSDVTLVKSNPSMSYSVTNLTCYGQNSDGVYAGSITITNITGGNGGTYKYKLGSGSWTNYPGGTLVWGGLRGGTYNVYLRDKDDCEFSYSIAVTEPTQVTATISTFNPSCSNGSGSITVSSPTGGSGTGYKVKNGSGGTWADAPQTYSYSSSGDYTIYVKDSTPCETSYTRTITIPSVVTASISSASYPTCWNSTNGSIVINPGGGTGSYTYSINNGSSYQSSATFNNLSSDTYYIRVKDSNGCESQSLQSVDLNTSVPNANLSVTNATCYGGAGSVTTSSPTTTSTFFRFNSGQSFYNSSGTRYNVGTSYSALQTLTADYYTFRVYNFNETCYKDYVIQITQPTQQTASMTNVVGSGTSNNNGAITISSAGGTWNKTYRLYKDTASPYTDYPTNNLIATYTNVTSGSPSVNVTGLTCGWYWLQVTDANGCTTNAGAVEVTCPTQYYAVSIRSGSAGGNSTPGSACNNLANGAMYDVTIYTDSGVFTDGIAYADSSGSSVYYGGPGSGSYYSDGTNYGRISSLGVITIVGGCSGGAT